MNLRREGLHPADRPLDLLDDLRIPLDGCYLGVPPVAHRMRARAGQHDAVRLGGALQFLHRHGEVSLGFGHRAADPGHYLDGGLHQLVPHLGMLAAFLQARQTRQHGARVLPQHSRPRVDELHFPFDAKRRAR